MSETFIADMRHFTEPEDPALEIPGPAIRIRDFLGQIVESATAATPGTLEQTELRCRRRPGRKPCPGPLQVMLTEVPPQIRWLCPGCGDNGIITHWRGTPWDLTRGTRMFDAGGHPEILLTGAEYHALQEIDILDHPSRETVKRALPTSEGIVLSAPAEQLEDLAGFVAAEVNHEKRPSRQDVLRAVFQKLQSRIDPL